MTNATGLKPVSGAVYTHPREGSRFKTPRRGVEDKPMEISMPQFPIHALGSLSLVAREIADCFQSPLPIAAHSVLGVASFLAQQNVNVRHGSISTNTSLYLLCAADSGDRKSSCDKAAQSPLRDFERAGMEGYKNEQSQHQEQAKAAKKDGEEMPEPPKAPNVILSDATVEAIQRALVQGQSSQILSAEEAGTIFGGHSMRGEAKTATISVLSTLWDGSPIRRNRMAEGESYTAYDRRLCISLMGQPVVLEGVLSDPLMTDQGILARFLTAPTQSLAGTRKWRPKDIRDQPSYKAYCELATRFANQGYSVDDTGALELRQLRLTNDAAALFEAFYNNTEKAQSPTGEYAVIKPFASKAGEHCLRLAGVLAFWGGEDTVSDETMECAVELTQYYIDAALHLAIALGGDRQEQKQNELLTYLKTIPGEIEVNDLQKHSPPKLGLRKSVAAIRKAMSLMVSKGYVAVTQSNRNGDPSAWRLI